MKIIRMTGNDCGGFKPPKGHLDTQMFPECEGKETDRNIVRKTVERRKKKKKQASIITAKHGYPIIQEKTNQSKGIWDQWKDGEINDKKFVGLISELSNLGFSGVSKDPMIRKGILNALSNFRRNKDYAEAAKSISAFLSMGEHVSEEHFANGSNWYKRAMEDYPEFRGDIPASEKRWLHPSLKERVVEYFKENHPNITATFEEMWDWYRRNFTNIPKKFDWEKFRERAITPRRF
jgi:hypothetical protein